MVWKSGFGYANLESFAKCTGDSVMRIASISKPITATLAAQCVENGTLDLDEDIRVCNLKRKGKSEINFFRNIFLNSRRKSSKTKTSKSQWDSFCRIPLEFVIMQLKRWQKSSFIYSDFYNENKLSITHSSGLGLLSLLLLIILQSGLNGVLGEHWNIFSCEKNREK